MHREVFDKISTNNIDIYLEKLRACGGSKYKFSTTPVFLRPEVFDNIVKSSEVVLRVLADQKNKKDYTNDFLKPNKINRDDIFGSIDFHVNGDDIKIIEINMFPPSLASFIEVMETNYNELVFDSKMNLLSKGFLDKMINTISAQGSKKKMILSDYNIEDEYSLDEFKYIKKIMDEEGISIDLISAENINKDSIKNIDRIYNRVTLKTWETHLKNLSGYTELYNTQPELFFTNPLAWKLSEKDYINSIKEESIKISDDKISDIFLKTNKLSDYENIDELKDAYISRSKIIIKPIDSFGSKGVLLKPSNKMINECLAKNTDKYIVQELFPPDRMPYLKMDGSVHSLKFDLRVVFMEEKIVGVYARVYEGGITNFSGVDGGIAPVFTINE